MHFWQDQNHLSDDFEVLQYNLLYLNKISKGGDALQHLSLWSGIIQFDLDLTFNMIQMLKHDFDLSVRLKFKKLEKSVSEQITTE